MRNTPIIDTTVAEIEAELDALVARAEAFIARMDGGAVLDDDALAEGTGLIETLANTKYIAGDKRFMDRGSLFAKLRRTSVRVFKRCIPESAAALRPYAEVIVGSKKGSYDR